MDEPRLVDFKDVPDVEKRERLFTLFSLRAGVPPELIVRRITVAHGEHYEPQARLVVRAVIIEKYGPDTLTPAPVREFVEPPPPLGPPAGFVRARQMFLEGKDVDLVGSELWDMYRGHSDPSAIITRIINQARASADMAFKKIPLDTGNR